MDSCHSMDDGNRVSWQKAALAEEWRNAVIVSILGVLVYKALTADGSRSFLPASLDCRENRLNNSEIVLCFT